MPPLEPGTIDDLLRFRIQPDVVIFRDADSLPLMDNVTPLDHVLLVGEVVSGLSIRIDREVKPRLCAQAGVPFYLLVDRFTEPLSVSLYGQPGAEGYTAITTVGVGEKLHLPESFGIALDASALPSPG
jgi:Uma2 family endonuclease